MVHRARRKYKKKKRQRTDAMVRHSRERMSERFGVQLDEECMGHIRHQIGCNLSTFIQKQSNTRTVHAVEIDSKTVLVVWDRERHVVRTVLPETDWRYKLLKEKQNVKP